MTEKSVFKDEKNAGVHASAQGFFGGEFDFDKMNFIEKTVIKKIAHINKSVSRINTQAVQDFVKTFKS